VHRLPDRASTLVLLPMCLAVLIVRVHLAPIRYTRPADFDGDLTPYVAMRQEWRSREWSHRLGKSTVADALSGPTNPVATGVKFGMEALALAHLLLLTLGIAAVLVPVCAEAGGRPWAPALRGAPFTLSSFVVSHLFAGHAAAANVQPAPAPR
jgi:hypothetical protein